MIQSFSCKDTERIFRREPVGRWARDLQRRCYRKLVMLDAAASLDDLRVPPSNRLEKLKGVRRLQWSIRVNDQWRICFRWIDGNVLDIEMVDYH